MSRTDWYLLDNTKRMFMPRQMPQLLLNPDDVYWNHRRWKSVYNSQTYASLINLNNVRIKRTTAMVPPFCRSKRNDLNVGVVNSLMCPLYGVNRRSQARLAVDEAE